MRKITLLTTAVPLLLAAAASAHAGGFIPPEGVSTYAGDVDKFYYIVLGLTGAIFVITELLLFGFSIAYRKRPGRKAHYTHGSHTLEFWWTLIPTLILLYLGISSEMLWAKMRLADIPEDAYTIEVKAEQWTWSFRYPGDDGELHTDDDLEVLNQLHIPAGRVVRFDIKSKDVLHGFYIPQLRVHQDTVPGLTTSLWVEATKTGEYDVLCTQFCGSEHYQMKGRLTVHTQEDFDAWLAAQAAESWD